MASIDNLDMTNAHKNTVKNNVGSAALWRSRSKFIAILSLFLGPLLAAFFWYYGLGKVFLPQGHSNYAPLINPVITLTAFQNNRLEQGPVVPKSIKPESIKPESFKLESLKHKWTIVHLLNSQCHAQCQQALYNTRQTRLALGKDAKRIQRYIVIDEMPANEIRQHHADATLLKQSASGIDKQLRPIIKQYNMGQHDALLVDPLGNVMMVIPLSLAPRLLLKDLKKLLKLSRIG